MLIRMPAELTARYKSPAQQARVVSEAWGQENLFCPSCLSSRLDTSAPNTQSVDFVCPECQSSFQLKSQSRPLARRLIDAAYGAMIHAIEENRTPNLLALHYDRSHWEVRNLVLIPHFAISLSCIEKRAPLGPTARRAGWVGCNIVLTHIAPDARIFVVADGTPVSPPLVREQYAKLRPLEKGGHEIRGWTLDVLRFVRCLKKDEFSLKDIYAFREDLRRLHPGNRFIEQKIRQRLQRLRDLGFVEFLGRGEYRLKSQRLSPVN